MKNIGNYPYATEELQKLADTLPPLLITELDKLLFPQFIECAVNNNLQVLVLSGNATEDQKNDAWMHLLSQYYGHSGNTNAATYIQKAAKISALDEKCTKVSILVASIELLHKSKTFTEEKQKLIVRLKEWGYTNSFSEDALVADLQSVGRQLSNDRLKLAVLRKEQEAEEQKKGRNQKAVTKDQYYKLLGAIEDMKGRSIDVETLDMYRFALYVNDLQERSRILNNKNRINVRH